MTTVLYDLSRAVVIFLVLWFSSPVRCSNTVGHASAEIRVHHEVMQDIIHTVKSIQSNPYSQIHTASDRG
jgi:hypothetical protein